MLAPETRMMLTDALRPPESYRVDTAVATTYSLDLTAMLLAPLSFALFDQEHTQDVDRIDPIRLLEAVRRHSEHTTVFCQAGAIAVPPQYRSMLTFIEDSVYGVMAPTESRIFHPKIWAVRFVDAHGRYLHRMLCLSRNLTFDRSWDTALRLDEDPDHDQPIDPQPLCDFLETLPSLVATAFAEGRQSQVRSLAETFATACLAPPAPFSTATLLPSGVGAQPWPFPGTVDRLLAISPFLTKGLLQRLADTTQRRSVVSRGESLDQVGSEAVDGWSTQTLQRIVEVEVGDDIELPDATRTEWDRPPDGLHAKTVVCDVGKESHVVTGSANLTGAAWEGNVEFGVLLKGPRRQCGVAAVLDGTADAPGLSRMLQDYTVSEPDGLSEAAQVTAWELELFHQRLAASAPTLDVTRIDEDSVRLELDLAVPDDAPGLTTVWPVSLRSEAAALELVAGEKPVWATISRRNVTPFLAVETTAGAGIDKATRRCVIDASLTGQVGERRRDVVQDILRSKDDVLRYLVFLLGDPSYDAWRESLSEGGENPFGDHRVGVFADVALLEPLVRAAGKDDEALARVASLVRELSDLPNGAELVPDGFDEVWQVVWEVHQEAASYD